VENRTARVPSREGFYNGRGGSICEGYDGAAVSGLRCASIHCRAVCRTGCGAAAAVAGTSTRRWR